VIGIARGIGILGETEKTETATGGGSGMNAIDETIRLRMIEPATNVYPLRLPLMPPPKTLNGAQTVSTRKRMTTDLENGARMMIGKGDIAAYHLQKRVVRTGPVIMWITKQFERVSDVRSLKMQALTPTKSTGAVSSLKRHGLAMLDVTATLTGRGTGNDADAEKRENARAILTLALAIHRRMQKSQLIPGTTSDLAAFLIRISCRSPNRSTQIRIKRSLAEACK
jgi:hypothetical protein